MIKLFVILAVLAGLLAGPATAIVDHGDSTVTRLWQMTSDGTTRFICTAFYVQPQLGVGGVWVVSAGHCAFGGGELVARNKAAGVFGVVNWRTVIERGGIDGLWTDFAIGTAPDPRSTAAGFEAKWPVEPFVLGVGEYVWVHGFPEGVERITVAQVLDSQGYKGLISLQARCDEIRPGSSGSPVVNRAGRVIGVLVMRSLTCEPVPYLAGTILMQTVYMTPMQGHQALEAP